MGISWWVLPIGLVVYWLVVGLITAIRGRPSVLSSGDYLARQPAENETHDAALKDERFGIPDDAWGRWGERAGITLKWLFVGGLFVWFGVVPIGGWRGAAWIGVGVVSCLVWFVWRRYVRPRG